jgi:hypothetical protein
VNVSVWLTGYRKTTALGITALLNGSKCSFTTGKLRFFALSRLVLPSLVTFFNTLFKVSATGILTVHPKFRLNIPDSFGRIRALLKWVGVELWHVYVK